MTAAKQTTSQTAARRRLLTSKVHIAAKQLGLDDDVYRDVLERLTGKRSASDCSIWQLKQVVDHFVRQGWQSGRASQKKSQKKRTQMDVILGQWKALANRGAHGGTDKELRDWTRRHTCTTINPQGIDHPKFATVEQKAKMIDMLEAWLARVKKELGHV